MKNRIVFNAPLESPDDGWVQSYTIDDVNISRTCGGVLCADDEHGLGAEREALLQETLAKVAADAAELRGALVKCDRRLSSLLDLIDYNMDYSDPNGSTIERLREIRNATMRVWYAVPFTLAYLRRAQQETRIEKEER